jgi:hypothetical protein
MPTEPYWNPLVPELTVTCLKTSLAFYQTAGFSVRFRRSSPEFAYIERGQAQIMLEETTPDGWHVAPLERPLGRGINFQIEVLDAAALHTAFVQQGHALFRGLTETWYAVSATEEEGQKEFLVQDPDGYLLRFAEALGGRVIA